MTNCTTYSILTFEDPKASIEFYAGFIYTFPALLYSFYLLHKIKHTNDHAKKVKYFGIIISCWPWILFFLAIQCFAFEAVIPALCCIMALILFLDAQGTMFTTFGYTSCKPEEKPDTQDKE